ncbi:hypothetical protein HLK59_38015 [Streptomyces sp. S3(2020)]|uniref:hypothetical protein n=1 Tax=Streptomyces sp. S3(2020) TaxID=2732044 RepID=UPI001489581C|nr:hypothetical protein [Streptomyces sp. S3(2020)]NNN36061.1 hypothetical protein [Streptomyces sp. S3(2020)]
MTPAQTITALALAALRNDAKGLEVLLVDLDDDEVRNACGVALLNLCNGFRQIVPPKDWHEVIAEMQALAAEHAQEA